MGRQHRFAVIVMEFDDIVVDERDGEVKGMGSDGGRLLG